MKSLQFPPILYRPFAFLIFGLILNIHGILNNNLVSYFTVALCLILASFLSSKHRFVFASFLGFMSAIFWINPASALVITPNGRAQLKQLISFGGAGTANLANIVVILVQMIFVLAFIYGAYQGYQKFQERAEYSEILAPPITAMIVIGAVDVVAGLVFP
jgi:hypothetical protein